MKKIVAEWQTDGRLIADILPSVTLYAQANAHDIAHAQNRCIQYTETTDRVQKTENKIYSRYPQYSKIVVAH